MLEDRADPFDRHALGVLDEEDGVGIAHADADRIAERAFRDAEMQRVPVFRERDFAPVRRRPAHVDRHAAVAVAQAVENAGFAFEGDFGAAGLVHQQRGGAAGAVAAGAGCRSVAVQEQQSVIRQAGRRRRNQHKLVAADTAAAVGDLRRCPGAGRRRAVPQVEHHEIVARAVHLDEGDAGGVEGRAAMAGRVHGRGDMVFPPRLSTRQSGWRDLAQRLRPRVVRGAPGGPNSVFSTLP